MNDVRTPCIGICSTTSLGDRVCRGCKRYADEVIHWNSYDRRAKRAVLARIERLDEQILRRRFRIVSPERLQAGLRRLKIPCDPALSPWCWLHNLLKKGLDELGEISELERVGVQLRPQCKRRDLAELSREIEDELLRLAEAHFDRYIDRRQSSTDQSRE